MGGGEGELPQHGSPEPGMTEPVEPDVDANQSNAETWTETWTEMWTETQRRSPAGRVHEGLAAFHCRTKGRLEPRAQQLCYTHTHTVLTPI